MFIHEGPGLYRFVGREHPYNGPLWWHPKRGESRVVGVWVGGKLTLVPPPVPPPTPAPPPRVMRAIRIRQGQEGFRTWLLVAYGSRCAITGCDAEQALEAAHILGYAETGDQDVTNGLLLRPG
jgi:hypothetical protein